MRDNRSGALQYAYNVCSGAQCAPYFEEQSITKSNLLQNKNINLKGGIQKMNTKLKNNQGITLIALIITIIILVILAAVSIRAVTNMGIVGHAVNGTQQYAREAVRENNIFDRITSLLDNTVVKINGIQDGCGVTLNKDKLGLQLEGNRTVTEQLTATVVNLIGDVEWSSSDEAVAKVSDDGLITAVSLGNTVITASIVFDGKEYTASCEVTITNVPVTSVDVTPASVTINKGGTTTLTAEVGPENVTDRTVTWTSGDEQIATVDANGVVTAVAGGTTQITARANDGSGYSAKCTVTVNVPVTGLALYKSGENANTAAASISATVEAEDTLTLVPVFTPNDASNQSITWSSNHENIATVSNAGVVTGVAEGTATITATANGGTNITATCTVTVASIPKPEGYAFTDSSTNTDYLWSDVHEMAKIISGMFAVWGESDSDEVKATKINKLSKSVTIEYPVGSNTNVTLTVGQTMTLKDTSASHNEYTVRILGFNTDKLASTSNVAGDKTYTGTYAGISFEFVSLLKYNNSSTTKAMNSSDTNKNGWGASQIRTDLNGTKGVGLLENKDYIKYVTKIYNKGNKGTTTDTSSDRLWLLACSEIFPDGIRTGYFGGCNTNESTMTDGIDSTRYKLYAAFHHNTAVATRAKPDLVCNNTSNWWLRSPYCDLSTNWCFVSRWSACDR